MRGVGNADDGDAFWLILVLPAKGREVEERRGAQNPAQIQMSTPRMRSSSSSAPHLPGHPREETLAGGVDQIAEVVGVPELRGRRVRGEVGGGGGNGPCRVAFR